MLDEEKLSRENIAKSDPKKLYQLFESWPANAEATLKKSLAMTPKRYQRVVYLAVGGSATAGDIISDWFLSSGGVEVSVFRGSLPKLSFENTLVIICSTSGDTLETLRMAEAVRGHSSDIVTISHNGKLSELADREGMMHVEIELAEAPRFSLPFSLFASIAVLRSANLLEGIEREIEETVSTLRKVAGSTGSASPLADNRSKQVALAIGTKEPCIYASSLTKSVARRFKNSMNENAKMHARFESAPDIFHNEVEAWARIETGHQPVILRRKLDPASESKTFDAFGAVLRSRDAEPTIVDATGEGNLSQLMSLCYTLDFASYYSALLNGVEPFEIALIDELKKSR
jgi:glucose/mannose-6-phosphate isomerase